MTEPMTVYEDCNFAKNVGAIWSFQHQDNDEEWLRSSTKFLPTTSFRLKCLQNSLFLSTTNLLYVVVKGNTKKIVEVIYTALLRFSSVCNKIYRFFRLAISSLAFIGLKRQLQRFLDIRRHFQGTLYHRHALYSLVLPPEYSSPKKNDWPRKAASTCSNEQTRHFGLLERNDIRNWPGPYLSLTN